jgi:hypothetical protein
MRQLVQASPYPAERAIREMFHVLDALRAGGATMFRDYPLLCARLDRMKGEEIPYFTHEFLNREWHTPMFADVAEAMAETKTTFIGSATVAENLDAVALQASLSPIFDTVLDPAIRETIRDVASSKPFRRDLWRKGGQRMAAPEQAALLDAIALISTGNKAGDDIVFPSLIGTATGRREFYRPLLDAIGDGPTTIGDLRAMPRFRDLPVGEFVEAAILLLGGNYVRPALRGRAPGKSEAGTSGSRARDAAARLNRVIIERIRMGLDIPLLAAPRIGAGVKIGIVEGLAIGGLLDGDDGSAETMIETALTGLARSARQVRLDGKPVDDPAIARAIVAEAIRELIENRLPSLRLVGAVP